MKAHRYMRLNVDHAKKLPAGGQVEELGRGIMSHASVGRAHTPIQCDKEGTRTMPKYLHDR